MADQPPASWADLPSGVLSCLFASLSTLQGQLGAARACTAWRSAALQLHAARGFALRAHVTLAAENRVVVLGEGGETVQSFIPLPPSRRKGRRKGGAGSWRDCKTLFRWPTCMAFGRAPGSLYISQYRVRGVVQFDTGPTGTTYRYTRVVCSSPLLESPEGIVVNADGSLLVVSAAHGTINHVSAEGTVTQTVLCCSWTRDNSLGTFRVPWGMCRGPDGALYVAVHASDGDDYTRPTPRDTGDILRIEPNHNGAITAKSEHLGRVDAQDMMPRILTADGEGWSEWTPQELAMAVRRNRMAAMIREEWEYTRAAEPGLGLNRPSNPCFHSPAGGPPALVITTFAAAGESGGDAAADAVCEAELGSGEVPIAPERKHQRGIAVFEVPPGCGGSGRQDAAAAAQAATVGVEEWSPWGLCSHGNRLFATGHSVESSHDRADDDQTEQQGAAAQAVGKAHVGSVRVWEGDQWRVLRDGLREPNYILVC